MTLVAWLFMFVIAVLANAGVNYLIEVEIVVGGSATTLRYLSLTYVVLSACAITVISVKDQCSLVVASFRSDDGDKNGKDH